MRHLTHFLEKVNSLKNTDRLQITKVYTRWNRKEKVGELSDTVREE